MAGRKKRSRFIWLGVIIVIVIVVATYAVRIGSGAKNTTGSADSLTASDTTSGEDDQKAEKSKEDKNKQEKEEIDRVPVEVAEAQPRAISQYYLTTAALDPEKKVDILAKIAGEVSKINVEEGNMVKGGALLCELDDKEQKIALEEARINRDKKKREFERLKAIHEQSLISDLEFSDAQYQYELAKNKYDAALLRYEYTKIRAPFSGVITLRAVDKGENISIGSKLFEIADTDPLLLRLYLPENEIASIKIGQEVIITPDSDPGTTLSGRITLISPSVDERTGTIKVTVETRGNAMPGSFVRIQIVTDTHVETLAVPRRGVIADAGETFVFVAEADTARKIAVKIGFEDEDYAEIVEGIELGDTVVVVGAGGLKTGTNLNILNRSDADSLIQTAGSDSLSKATSVDS